MDSFELQLIEKYSAKDAMLGKLYQEHLGYERQLNKFDRKPFLTPQEEMERKRLQKMKLKGRDQITLILARYR